uniref:Uncharacterized protein n=1 Tax=Ditylum brightwellii TaxID=49249 RepID=A0A6V2AED8_9STRA
MTSATTSYFKNDRIEKWNVTKKCRMVLLLSILLLAKMATAVTTYATLKHTRKSWSGGQTLQNFITSDMSSSSFDANVTEYWFDTIVDHFNFQPTAVSTFPLRYFVNDQYCTNHDSSSTPVLFYAGNEAPITQFIQNSGFLFEAAKHLGAMVVFAEHRYYGQSFPFGSPTAALTTPFNISYLTVEQAMEDFNALQLHIRHKWNLSRDAAFIVAGGSYGGNLALWLRLKNPNLWAGALASSATPLKHLLRESNSFSKIVSEVYGNVSSTCPDIVRRGWMELFENVKSKHGRDIVQHELQLCHMPDEGEQYSEDIANELYQWISGALETMVQYGYPYPTNFYNPVPAYPFQVACENMLKEPTALESLRAAAQVYYNFTGQAGLCFDWLSSSSTFAGNEILFATPDAMRKVKQRNALLKNNLVETAWDYQCCTEVYQPMPTDGITDMELPYRPSQTQYFERCQQRWDGVTPRPDWEEMTFMSNNIQAGSNIFLTSGQLDPWRAAGITSLPNHANPDSIIVRVIENGAHHLDLRASHPLDPPSVTKIRREELASFEHWVHEWGELYPAEVKSPKIIAMPGLRGNIQQHESR